MNKITLSYVITTYNKLPYLKEAMKRLLENVKEDEEIIVTDGASTDGTVEYLTELYQQGKIHQFISELDKGEAHGYNKCLLMAKGELIKIITDDDVFYYPAIQECKKFMLEHPEVDVISGNMSSMGIENPHSITILKWYEDEYRKWLQTKVSFAYGGLSLMIRKSSLPLTGLFFTGVIGIDIEFTLRITHLNVCIAWYTALMVIRIDNPQSNLRKIDKLSNRRRKQEEDHRRYYLFYNPEYSYETTLRERPLLEILQEIMKRPLRIVRDFLKYISNRKQDSLVKNNTILIENKNLGGSNLSDIFKACETTLYEYNQANSPDFILSKNVISKTMLIE
ncbi:MULTISPECIES: glycosyltransferase [unclassified Nodularia (in: cyanobacteria)]|uniref:glycosyltransferase n=1 Tax=unclassified Nodularia (in: cyanobacteria) TaxID=2656917 RepID=UPI0018822AF0|nr:MULTISPECIES: glycosyltransferase [unclassified Nodularia (in: cyanobacteria)]MBE9199405.1 glycosyltransferase [Nodularia sp. LEGE 06071]MCC2692903.1 glycosyltransferase [Nodularia sp. LEGE 04288]